jgi:hypothetical protein
MCALPLSVLTLFAEAGWHPGRSVPVASEVAADHPVFSILQTFGGLRVGVTGEGRECAKSDVTFKWHAGKEYSEEEVIELSNLLQTQMICFSDAHKSHSYLFGDRYGRVFVLSEGDLGLQGYNFGEAMERLLLGYRPAPIILPSQKQVTFFGEVKRVGDSGLLSWEQLRDVEDEYRPLSSPAGAEI